MHNVLSHWKCIAGEAGDMVMGTSRLCCHTSLVTSPHLLSMMNRVLLHLFSGWPHYLTSMWHLPTWQHYQKEFSLHDFRCRPSQTQVNIISENITNSIYEHSFHGPSRFSIVPLIQWSFNKYVLNESPNSSCTLWHNIFLYTQENPNCPGSTKPNKVLLFSPESHTAKFPPVFFNTGSRVKSMNFQCINTSYAKCWRIDLFAFTKSFNIQ